jgi:hypothetical protein
MIKFLFIAIPGTLIGDLLLAWMRFSEKSFEKRTSWNRWRFVGIIGLMLFSIIAMLVGLQGRYLIATLFTGIGICIVGALLLRKPVTSVEKLLHQFFSWGSFWLILGLALEPYEGGIKKEDATLSFFFITTALAIFLLIALTVIIDVFRKKRWVQLLIDNGQNPMIAYIGRWTFVKPVLVLIGAEAFLTRTLTNPWPGFFHSVILTSCVALFVSFCTRRKLFWRT